MLHVLLLMAVQVVSFSVVGEWLTGRLRVQAFQSMLQREVWWFDHHSHSPSFLSSLLFTETPLMQGGRVVEATLMLLCYFACVCVCVCVCVSV